MSKNPIATPNFKMIHIASELVALAGLTFYFTSKNNTLQNEIKKLQSHIQRQEARQLKVEKDLAEALVKVKTIEQLLVADNPPPFMEDFSGGKPLFGGGPGGPEIIAQMMSGPLFPQPAQQFNKTPEHNISVVEQDELETDSQLDKELESELAELSDGSARASPDPRPPPTQLPSHRASNTQVIGGPPKLEKMKPMVQNKESGLNKKSPSNNSQLSLQDD